MNKRIHIFWTVENTGWSDGTSWFECGARAYGRETFSTDQQALEYLEKHKKTHNDPDNAMSDANTVMNIKHLENVLGQAKAAHEFRLEMLDKFGEDNVHP